MSEPTTDAIEAAGYAVFLADHGTPELWHFYRETYSEEARIALTAAAPFMVREAQAKALEEASEALYQEGREVLKGEQAKKWPVRIWSASKREGYEIGIITGRTILCELRARAAATRDGAQ